MGYQWKKYGLIFGQEKMPEWASKGALTPTPFVLNDEVVRVFCGFRDSKGVSRIGYVDLLSEDPTQVIAVSKTPVLDIGRPGCFDDNGVILGDVIRAPDGQFRMYYVGFQLVKRAKFLAFSGLATSADCSHFVRVSESPILDRTDHANMIRAIHSINHENGIWRAWYAAGDGWQEIMGNLYPKYNIWHTTSADGICFGEESTLCVDNEGDEYRIGRPSVYCMDGRYVMLYTKGSSSGTDYFPGLAYSADGIIWQRVDSELNLSLGGDGDFDDRHLCYPRIFHTKSRAWAVYNGNDMGANGFGLMELIV